MTIRELTKRFRDIRELPGVITEKIEFVKELATRVKYDDREAGEYYALQEDVFVVVDVTSGDTIYMSSDEGNVERMFRRLDTSLYTNPMMIHSVNDMINAAYRAGYVDARNNVDIDVESIN